MNKASSIYVLSIDSQNVAFYAADYEKLTGITGYKCVQKIRHEGFTNGEWTNYSDSLSKVNSLLTDVFDSIDAPNKKLFISVPSSFTRALAKDITINYQTDITIDEPHVSNIGKHGANFLRGIPDLYISSSPIYYTVNDKKRTFNPIGERANKLTAFLSYLVANTNFKKFIEQVLTLHKITNYELISDIWANVISYFDQDMRKENIIVTSINHLDTTIAIARGDSITALANIPVGFAHFLTDVSLLLSLPYSDILTISDKINILTNDDSNYKLTKGKYVVDIPKNDVDNIIKARVEEIGKEIEKAIVKFGFKSSPQTPIYMFNNSRVMDIGVNSYLSHITKREIKEVINNKLRGEYIPFSAYAILEIGSKIEGLKKDKKHKNKFIDIIKGLFSRRNK